MDVPSAVYEYAFAEVMGARNPAFLLVNEKGRVVDCGGGLAWYGLSNLPMEEPVSEHVDFLEGLLPIDEPSFVLPCVETEAGIPAEVHIFKRDEGHWILLLDASMDMQKERFAQQKEYNVDLLQQKQAKVLDGFLGPVAVQKVVEEDMGLSGPGNRFEGSVLVAGLDGLSAGFDGEDPEERIASLRVYLPGLVESVVDEKGFVDRIDGHLVVGVFGLNPGQDPSSLRAARTAFRMVKEAKDASTKAAKSGKPLWKLTAGIASGPLVLAVIGSPVRHTLSTIGPALDEALQLQSQAAPGEILADEKSVAEMGKFAKLFKAGEQSEVDGALSCRMG